MMIKRETELFDLVALFLEWIARGEWGRSSVDMKDAGAHAITTPDASKFGGHIMIESREWIYPGRLRIRRPTMPLIPLNGVTFMIEAGLKTSRSCASEKRPSVHAVFLRSIADGLRLDGVYQNRLRLICAEVRS